MAKKTSSKATPKTETPAADNTSRGTPLSRAFNAAQRIGVDASPLQRMAERNGEEFASAAEPVDMDKRVRRANSALTRIATELVSGDLTDETVQANLADVAIVRRAVQDRAAELNVNLS